MAAPTFLYWNGRNGRALSTVYKKLLPGALLWDYENWPKIKITREGWRGSPALSVLFVLFFPLCWLVLCWAGLDWVGSGFYCLFLEHRDPFFPLPIKTRCAQTRFKNSDPLFGPTFRAENLARHIFSHTDRNTHTYNGRHAHKHSGLRQCNHRGPKGIPEQKWAPITSFSAVDARLIHQFPKDVYVVWEDPTRHDIDLRGVHIGLFSRGYPFLSMQRQGRSITNKFLHAEIHQQVTLRPLKQNHLIKYSATEALACLWVYFNIWVSLERFPLETQCEHKFMPSSYIKHCR